MKNKTLLFISFLIIVNLLMNSTSVASINKKNEENQLKMAIKDSYNNVKNSLYKEDPHQIDFKQKETVIQSTEKSLTISSQTDPHSHIETGDALSLYSLDGHSCDLLSSNLSINFQFMFGSYGSNEGEFLDYPKAVTIADNKIFVGEYRGSSTGSAYGRVQAFDLSGNFLFEVTNNSVWLWDMTTDGDYIYVSQRFISSSSPFGMGYINVYDTSGNYIKNITAPYADMRGITIYDNKLFWGAGLDNAPSIVVYDLLEEEFIDEFGIVGEESGEFNGVFGLSVYNEEIYAVDRNNHRIQVLDLKGNYVREWGIEGTGNGEFNYPYDIHVDAQYVYVADLMNNRVQIFDHQGKYLSQFGTFGSGEGEFDRVYGLSIKYEQIYVVDRNNHRIQVFNIGSIDTTDPVIESIDYSPDQPSDQDDITITTTVTDSVEVAEVILSYRINEGAWTNTTMTALGNDNYSVTIGAFDATVTIEFTIYAYDTSDNFTKSATHAFTILDKTAPVIESIDYSPDQPTDQDNITITATVTDNVKVSKVVLHYRIDQGNWHTSNMISSNSVYSATIGFFDLGVTITFYICASDETGNSVESDQMSFTVESPDDLDPNHDPEEITVIAIFSNLSHIVFSLLLVSIISLFMSKKRGS